MSTPGIERPEPVSDPAAAPRNCEGGSAETLLQPRRDQPDHARVPALAARHQHGRPLTRAKLRVYFRDRLANRGSLDRLALRRSAGRAAAAILSASTGSAAVSRRAPRLASPIRPPALMRGPSRKPRWLQSGGTFEARGVDERAQSDALRMAESDEALIHERAVQARQRNHVADRPERHQLEQRKEIGKRAGEIAPSENDGGAPLRP